MFVYLFCLPWFICNIKRRHLIITKPFVFTTDEHLQQSSQEAAECEVPTKEAGAHSREGPFKEKESH